MVGSATLQRWTLQYHSILVLSGYYTKHTAQKPPNKACTGRLGLCTFFGALSERWQFPVSKLVSPQPPVTQTVNCNNMCYMSKSSENVKFSRVFDDSSSQKV
jgi:hypothetical protein